MGVLSFLFCTDSHAHFLSRSRFFFHAFFGSGRRFFFPTHDFAPLCSDLFHSYFCPIVLRFFSLIFLRHCSQTRIFIFFSLWALLFFYQRKTLSSFGSFLFLPIFYHLFQDHLKNLPQPYLFFWIVQHKFSNSSGKKIKKCPWIDVFVWLFLIEWLSSNFPSSPSEIVRLAKSDVKLVSSLAPCCLTRLCQCARSSIIFIASARRL